VYTYHRIVSYVGPIYFREGSSIFEKLFAYINDWPSPYGIGSNLVLPLFDSTLKFKIPDIGLPLPPVRNPIVDSIGGGDGDGGDGDSGPLIEVSSIISHPSPSDGTEGEHLRATSLSSETLSSSPGGTDSYISSGCPSGLHSATHSTPSSPSPADRLERGDKYKQSESVGAESSLSRRDRLDSSNNMSKLLGADSDDMGSKVSMPAGLYQETPLFKLFGGVSGCAWHLWELALTGQPILIIAPSVDVATQASLAVASLISPIGYAGDLRPFYTIYDRDHYEIQKLHDSSKGKKIPACIYGVTNPFISKVCCFNSLFAIDFIRSLKIGNSSIPSHHPLNSTSPLVVFSFVNSGAALLAQCALSTRGRGKRSN
jgi:hypothetical protein